MPKYVVSTTMSDEDATWENSTAVIRGDIRGEIELLEKEVEGDILVAGSATLVRSLDEYGLVDTKPVGPDGILVLTHEPTD